MKKTLVIVIVFALILVLALATGCGKTDESGANNTGADEEVARGSVSLIDSIDTGGLSLDDVNILDESDEDASFRAGSHQVGEDWEAASAN